MKSAVPPNLLDLIINLLPSFYLGALFLFLSHSAARLLSSPMSVSFDDLFLFLGVSSVHLFDHLGLRSPEDAFNHPYRRRTLGHYKFLTLVLCLSMSLVSGLGLLMTLPTPVDFVGLAALGGVIYVAYSYGYGGWRLKNIYGIKSMAVSAAWLLLVIAQIKGRGLPIFVASRPDGWVFASLFVLLISDTLLLDWLDRVGDRQVDIVSYPPRWDRYLGLGVCLANLALGAIFLSLISQSSSLAPLAVPHLTIGAVAVFLGLIGDWGGLNRTLFISLWMPFLWLGIHIFGH